MVPAIREVVEKLNSENVIFDTKPMEEIVAESLAARRFSMILLSVFAALALLLSSIGIYGVISYVVGQRTHEIGIRMALGAQRGDVLRLMLGEGMKMALIGVARPSAPQWRSGSRTSWPKCCSASALPTRSRSAPWRSSSARWPWPRATSRRDVPCAWIR